MLASPPLVGFPAAPTSSPAMSLSGMPCAHSSCLFYDPALYFLCWGLQNALPSTVVPSIGCFLVSFCPASGSASASPLQSTSDSASPSPSTSPLVSSLASSSESASECMPASARGLHPWLIVASPGPRNYQNSKFTACPKITYHFRGGVHWENGKNT